MKLAIGTAQFGLDYGVSNQTGKVSRGEVSRILGFARAFGIDMLDTAIAYGDSEAALGSAGVSDFQIVTKVGNVATGRKQHEWMQEQVEASCRRLRVDSLYGVLLHRSPTTDLEAWRYALISLKESGLAKRVGVSVYSPFEIDYLLDALPLDIVQCPFNVIDRRMLDSGAFERMKSLNVEVHVRSVFLQGLLLMPPEGVPPHFLKWANVLERFQSWRLESGMVASEACIRYARAIPFIDRIVVGVESEAQLQEIHRYFSLPGVTAPDDLGVDDEALVDPSRWTL